MSTFEFDVESSAAAHPARMLYALPYGAEQQSSMKSVRASRECCHGGAQNRQGRNRSKHNLEKLLSFHG